MSLWSSKLVSGLRLTVMTHCFARNAPLLLPLERPFACDGVEYVKISHLPNGQLSFPVVKIVCVCSPEESGAEGAKAMGGKVNDEMSVGEGKRLIHTAGTVVASPASLTLATVRSDTSTVDTLLGTASC